MSRKSNGEIKTKAPKVKKTFIEDDDLKELASKIIEKHGLDYLNGVNIKYILVSPYISKTVAGKCIKPNPELEHFSGADFIIEMSESLWESLNDDVKTLLMYHELLHADVTPDAEGNTKYSIVDHDVKDFEKIISTEGIDWINKIKVTSASIYDFQNFEQDKIKI